MVLQEIGFFVSTALGKDWRNSLLEFFLSAKNPKIKDESARIHLDVDVKADLSISNQIKTSEIYICFSPLCSPESITLHRPLLQFHSYTRSGLRLNLNARTTEISS